MIRILLRKSQGKLFHVAGHTAQNPGGGGSHFVHAHQAHGAEHAQALTPAHGLPPRTGPRPTTNMPIHPQVEAALKTDATRVDRDRWISGVHTGGKYGYVVHTAEGHTSTLFDQADEAAAVARDQPNTPLSKLALLDVADVQKVLKGAGIKRTRGETPGYSTMKIDSKRQSITFDSAVADEPSWGGDRPLTQQIEQDAADALTSAGYEVRFGEWTGFHVAKRRPEYGSEGDRRPLLPWPKTEGDWDRMHAEAFHLPARTGEEDDPILDEKASMGFRVGYADVRNNQVGVRKVRDDRSSYSGGYAMGIAHAQRKLGERMAKGTRRLVVRLSALPAELVEDDGYGNLKLRKAHVGAHTSHGPHGTIHAVGAYDRKAPTRAKWRKLSTDEAAQPTHRLEHDGHTMTIVQHTEQIGIKQHKIWHVFHHHPNSGGEFVHHAQGGTDYVKGLAEEHLEAATRTTAAPTHAAGAQSGGVNEATPEGKGAKVYRFMVKAVAGLGLGEGWEPIAGDDFGGEHKISPAGRIFRRWPNAAKAQAAGAYYRVKASKALIKDENRAIVGKKSNADPKTPCSDGMDAWKLNSLADDAWQCAEMWSGKMAKSAIPGIHSAVRARDVAAVAGAPEPVTELPGSKMQDGAGRVLRGRFSCGRYQFEFQKAASGLSVVSASGGKLPMSFHMVVRGYDTARADAPSWVKEFEAGRVPMEGVFKKTGDTGRVLTLRKAAGAIIPAVHRGGGEGSRGGHVVGHTATGQPKYESLTADQHAALANDHFGKMEETRGKLRQVEDLAMKHTHMRDAMEGGSHRRPLPGVPKLSPEEHEKLALKHWETVDKHRNTLEKHTGHFLFHAHQQDALRREGGHRQPILDAHGRPANERPPE